MISISSAFDGGNIEVVNGGHSKDPVTDRTEAQSNSDQSATIRLKVRKDNASDFLQWFYFRVMGASDQQNLSFTIENASECSYPEGWKDYSVVVSYDREFWFRVPCKYDGQSLCFDFEPEQSCFYCAYFAPYSLERHHDLVAECLQSPMVTHELMGRTVQGRSMDLLQLGTPGPGKKNLWFIARQHPGETMAQWWMEGFLERMTDEDDPVVRGLLEKAVFYVVPNMNPDGSFLGNLRTNGAGKNLNREWESPSQDQSPEVFYTLQAMEQKGVDFCLDVHGDEALPYNFIAGAEGIPSWTKTMDQQLQSFKSMFANVSPDFQTVHGYPLAEPGQGNMTLCTNAIAERFQCLAMTLEMPFKDTADTPMPMEGWSPERSMKLGESVVDVLSLNFTNMF